MPRTIGGSGRPSLCVRSDTYGVISDPVLQLQEHAVVDPLLVPDGCCMGTSGGSYLSCPTMLFDVDATFLCTPVEQQRAKNAIVRAWYDGRRKFRIQPQARLASVPLTCRVPVHRQ